MSDQHDAPTTRSKGLSMGRAAVGALLAASAFLFVTVLGFFWASNAGDDSLSASDSPATSQIAGSADDVAASVEIADPNAGATNGVVSFVIDPTAPATIVGSVTTVDGSAVADSPVHLFLAEGDLPVGEVRHTAFTQADGTFQISAPVGCYVIRFDPPAGRSVVGGDPHVDVPTCIDATIVRIQLDAQVL